MVTQQEMRIATPSSSTQPSLHMMGRRGFVLLHRPMHLCPVDTSCGMGTTVSSTTYCSNLSKVHRPIIEYDHRQHNPPGLHHFGADVTAFVGQEGDIYFDVALGLLEHIYRQQVFRKY